MLKSLVARSFDNKSFLIKSPGLPSQISFRTSTMVFWLSGRWTLAQHKKLRDDELPYRWDLVRTLEIGTWALVEHVQAHTSSCNIGPAALRLAIFTLGSKGAQPRNTGIQWSRILRYVTFRLDFAYGLVTVCCLDLPAFGLRPCWSSNSDRRRLHSTPLRCLHQHSTSQDFAKLKLASSLWPISQSLETWECSKESRMWVAWQAWSSWWYYINLAWITDWYVMLLSFIRTSARTDPWIIVLLPCSGLIPLPLFLHRWSNELGPSTTKPLIRTWAPLLASRVKTPNQPHPWNLLPQPTGRLQLHPMLTVRRWQ